jgi:hypothetical protein
VTRSEVFDPDWLGAREPADAAARAPELVEELTAELAGGPLVVHDLGCGTGSMTRWLGPLLPGPQHWVLHDRDPALLERALADLPPVAADGSAVTAEARLTHLDRLVPADVADADLVTASALLDLFTAAEVAALAGVCVAVGAPALLTLSVVGQVVLDPADPLDAAVAHAFDEHQRRVVGGRRLLGPDAVAVAADRFAALGARVDVRPSPWRLGSDRLTEAWLRGWVGAAAEQDPALPVDVYLARRLAHLAAGQLLVTVGHEDLLARPLPPP